MEEQSHDDDATTAAAAAAAVAATATTEQHPPPPKSEAEIFARLKEIRELLFDLRLPASASAASAASAAATNSTVKALASLAVATSPSTPASAAPAASASKGKHKSRKKNAPNLAKLWREVSDLVKTLTELRASSSSSSSSSTDSTTGSGGSRSSSTATIAAEDYSPSASSIDQIIDDIIPMFFQSWSHHHKAVEQLYPIYVSLAKTKHVLEQLLESGLYTEITLKEVEAGIAKLHRNVDELRRIARERATASPMTSTASDHSAAGAAAGDAPKASKGDLAAGALAFGPGLALVESKLQACNKDLASLRAALAAIDPALLPLHTRLIEIKHELASLLARHSPHAFSLAEVQILQDDLREIDSIRIDGKFLGKDDGAVLPGQAAVIWLLEACYDDVHELLALREAIGGDNPLRPVYERLVRIKGRLERAYTVAKWNMRMDDLVPLQIELGEIDNLRVDGKFLAPPAPAADSEDRDGDQAPHSTSAVTTATTTAAAAAAASAAAAVPEGQAVLHFLLHKCYRIVYKLQMAAEPVADALMPVYASLATLQRCLLELKKWRVRLAPRDLAMYQMRLAKIDDMRVDGRFYGEENGGGGGGGGAAGAAGAGQQQAQQGEVPEGQGVLHAMLDACYELLRELQSASESADDEDEIDLDDDDDDGDFDDDGYGDEDDREEDD